MVFNALMDSNARSLLPVGLGPSHCSRDFVVFDSKKKVTIATGNYCDQVNVVLSVPTGLQI